MHINNVVTVLKTGNPGRNCNATRMYLGQLEESISHRDALMDQSGKGYAKLSDFLISKPNNHGR